MSKTASASINLSVDSTTGSSVFNANAVAMAVTVGLLNASVALSTSYAALPALGLTGIQNVMVVPDATADILLSFDGGSTAALTIPAGGVACVIPFPESGTLHVKASTGTPTLEYALLK